MRYLIGTLPIVMTAALCGSVLDLAAADSYRQSRWGLRAKLGFNIKADFSDVSAATTLAVPPQAGGGIDRIYEDGYVRVDANGNPGGTTWFWGYQDNAQYDPSGAGAILMHATSEFSSADSTGAKDDPQFGWELSYERDLGTIGHSWWGVEAAIGMGIIDINDHRSLAGTGTGIEDRFGLGGAVPPIGPYNGSFGGPGVLLDDTPGSRTTTQTAGTVSGFRRLESQLITFRFGPYIHYPASEHWSFSLSAGPALAFVDSEFSFAESMPGTGGPGLQRSGDASDNSVCFGAYVDGRVHYDFNPRWSVFAGLQYNYLQDSEVTANGKRAQLKTGAGMWAEFGVGYTY